MEDTICGVSAENFVIVAYRVDLAKGFNVSQVYRCTEEDANPKGPSTREPCTPRQPIFMICYANPKYFRIGYFDPQGTSTALGPLNPWLHPRCRGSEMKAEKGFQAAF